MFLKCSYSLIYKDDNHTKILPINILEGIEKVKINYFYPKINFFLLLNFQHLYIYGFCCFEIKNIKPQWNHGGKNIIGKRKILFYIKLNLSFFHANIVLWLLNSRFLIISAGFWVSRIWILQLLSIVAFEFRGFWVSRLLRHTFWKKMIYTGTPNHEGSLR